MSIFQNVKCEYMIANSEPCKQVTRDHNIVPDGWAGAANPHPHPTPLPTQKHTQTASKRLVFPLFDLCSQTDRQMDRWTDKASYHLTPTHTLIGATGTADHLTLLRLLFIHPP